MSTKKYQLYRRACKVYALQSSRPVTQYGQNNILLILGRRSVACPEIRSVVVKPS